jgi:hypothetical protein
MNKKAIIEAVKEIARLAVFGAIGAVLTWATSKVGSFDPTSIQYLVVTAVIRFVDKWVHANENIKAKGLLPF